MIEVQVDMYTYNRGEIMLDSQDARCMFVLVTRTQTAGTAEAMCLLAGALHFVRPESSVYGGGTGGRPFGNLGDQATAKPSISW